jgi:hypothetical protein
VQTRALVRPETSLPLLPKIPKRIREVESHVAAERVREASATQAQACCTAADRPTCCHQYLQITEARKWDAVPEKEVAVV